MRFALTVGLTSAIVLTLALPAAFASVAPKAAAGIAPGGTQGTTQADKDSHSAQSASAKPQDKARSQTGQNVAQVHGFIPPSDINVQIVSDVRSLVVMAAVNMAGFDFETGGAPLSPARAELRRDLAGMPPALKAQLATFYSSHRRAGVDEAADALRYETLAMLMNQPPGFI
ncbi:MAG: hypothetical protein ACREDR_36975, partial [Blastocatellia bacterium]